MDSDAVDSEGVSSSGAAMPAATGSTSVGSTGDGGESSGGFADTGDSEEPPVCECEGSVPIGAAELVDPGVSAESVLALVADVAIPWEWTGLDGLPDPTTLHIQVAWTGEQIMSGPEGTNGCGFTTIPCANALTIPVTAQVSTDDGVLVATTTGILDVDLDWTQPSIWLASDAPFERVVGTLHEQQLEDIDQPPVFLRVMTTWNLDGSWRHSFVLAGSRDDDMVLGEGFAEE